MSSTRRTCLAVSGPSTRWANLTLPELAVPAPIEPVLGLLPRGAGDRRAARLAAEAGVGAEPLRPGGAADQQRRGQRPAALLVQQRRPVGADQLEQLPFELIGLPGERADVGEFLARDPQPYARRELS